MKKFRPLTFLGGEIVFKRGLRKLKRELNAYVLNLKQLSSAGKNSKKQ